MENQDQTKSNHLKESGWVFITCSSLFYYISIFTHKNSDFSYYSVSSPANAHAENAAGQIGAEISAHAMTWLGGISFVLPVLVAALYYSIMRTRSSKSKALFLFSFLFQLTFFTAILTLVSSLLTNEHLGGGWIGKFLSTSTLNSFGEVGSWLVVIPAILISLNMKTKRSFIYQKVVHAIETARDFILKSFSFTRSSTETSDVSETNSFDEANDYGATSFPTQSELECSGLKKSFYSKLKSFFVKTSSPRESEEQTSQNDQQPNAPSIEHISHLEMNENEIPPIEHDFPYIEPDLIKPSYTGDQEPVEQNNFHSMMEKQLWEGNLPAQIDYKIPSSSIFKSSSSEGVTSISDKEMKEVGDLLTKTLLDFGVTGKIIGYQPGPVVTVYEFQPDAGIKQSKITGLIDDIALSLKVDSILIQPVKGKRALGVQVPNSHRQVVFFGDVVTSKKFSDAPSPLTFAMGKALDGQPVLTDLTGMPHLLVAGATGSGKSVGINSLICSVVMKASPAEVRMILVDPKMLELSVYEGIPHLLMPVITEAAKASLALRWAVNEMERRYKIMQNVQVRNIQAFNAFWKKQSEEDKQSLRDKLSDQEIDHMPFILLVIDELADLMLTAPKEVESVIQRLAQKARASGIHMVLATQRPSVDIITGVIKANLPSRIAFQVVSKHDSRTILDQMGADKLLGKGDMLFQKPGISKIDRIQGAFVSDEEVVNLVSQIKSDHPASYNEDLIDWIDNEASKQDVSPSASGIEFDDDPKWDDAISIAQRNGQISASFLQRQLKIGYNRAARIVEAMEAQGLVDQSSGSKPRKWIGHQEVALPDPA